MCRAPRRAAAQWETEPRHLFDGIEGAFSARIAASDSDLMADALHAGGEWLGGIAAYVSACLFGDRDHQGTPIAALRNRYALTT
jgi:hypothetical protein